MVDDREIRYQSFSMQTSVPIVLTQSIDLSGLGAFFYGVNGIDVEGKPQAWSKDGTYPTRFYTFGEGRIQMVKRVVVPARPAPGAQRPCKVTRLTVNQTGPFLSQFMVNPSIACTAI